MNTYAFIVKAKAKSDKKNLFCWFSAKSDSRADREIMNILEDAEIETGRNADYQLPIRTNWHVVDDLPEESTLDDTWCDRYELDDDGKSWRQIPINEPKSTNIQDDHASTAGTQPTAASGDTDGTIAIDQTTFNQRVVGAWLYDSFTKLFAGQQHEIREFQHDMDATYPQNLLLALNNAKDLLQLQHCFPETLFELIRDIKSIWPADGKAPDVGSLVTFSKEWINAHNNQSESSGGPFREDVTAKWIAKHGMKRTDAGTNAGGNNHTDRNPDYKHTLDTLDIEIAMATLPMDFDIYEIPGPIYRRAKEIIANKEAPFRTWSQKLRNMPGILDFSRAAIFALIRNANPDIIQMPGSLQTYINTNLTESDHANPAPELLALAGHLPAEDTNLIATESQQPEMKNLGSGMFSIDGLNAPTLNDGENHSAEAGNVQVETNGGLQVEAGAPVSENEGIDAELEEAFAKTEDEYPNLSALADDKEQQNIPENIPVGPDDDRIAELESRIAHLENSLVLFASVFTKGRDLP